jgi:hypothetical protein
MNDLTVGWWLSILFITFSIFFLLAILLRNHAAKRDFIGKTEKESVDNSVSISPRRTTRKFE